MKRGKLDQILRVFSSITEKKKKADTRATIRVSGLDEKPKKQEVKTALLEEVAILSSFRNRHTSAIKRQSNVISTGFEDRLAERKKSERVRIIRQISILGIILICLLVFVWVFFFSSLLAYETKNTKISGIGGAIEKNPIMAVLKTYSGTPLLRISTSTLEQDIAQTNTWIKNVQVERQFPHGLVIKITPRQAMAVYQKKQLLAEDAKILEAKTIPAGLPRVDSHCSANRNEKCLKFVISILKILPADLSKDLKNVEISQSASLQLHFSDGKHVIWGTDDNNDKKLKILKILIKEPGHIYNISNYSTPSVK